ncbi:DNA polymerase III subunit chi [Variovorax sp. OV329]|uniref:DNA polymerase III subunit chi n=1 Tax=Variovorax sp. OV329 TaxID=1882825 RepID=UPI0008F0857A|nr:DNA polymerase III subunit chi [Variovorax sp. OV329]SFM67235.1 DNA polymerase III, chi subunit [Variovorax sp. OV329]
MTDIEFRFNLPDPVDYACRLLRKGAMQGGAQLVVTGSAATLEAIDAALWQTEPTDFVAHCRADAPAEVLQRSPVVLAAAPDAALPHRSVLVNLGSEVPAGFERFERLIELVAEDEAARGAGRARWRHYKDRGYGIRHQDAFASAGGRA